MSNSNIQNRIVIATTHFQLKTKKQKHFLKEKTKTEKNKKESHFTGDGASLPKGNGINDGVSSGFVFMPEAFGSDIVMD